MTTTQQLRDDMAAARVERDRFIDEMGAITRAAGNADLSAGQLERWNNISIAAERARARITEATNELDARRDRLTGGGLSTTTGDGAEAFGEARSSFNVNRGFDPAEIFDRSGLDPRDESSGAVYRSRALASIESWQRSIPASYRESAARLVEAADDSERDRTVADHLLKLGSPEYMRAFKKFLRNPTQVALLPEADRAALSLGFDRAMSEGSGGVGGFIVPPFLDPSIILTNAGISNPFRSIATIKTITTQTWKGVTSQGVTAEWTAEASEMTDASPTLTQPTITPIRADAYIQASFEMLEDTNIAQELAMLFADARDRLEGTAFAVGTGSTQPFGVITTLNLTTTSRVATTTAGAFGAVDVFNADNNLPQRWRANASWVANKSLWNLARQFATGTGALTGAFWVDFGAGRPSTLIGYPVHESSPMASTVTTGANIIVVGDFTQYYIVDRIGMSVAYNPLVLGPNRRPTGEVGWATFWRVGGNTVNADAFRMLRA